MVVELGRDWVAIFNVDGQYYAIKDVCTHDDGPLAEGELRKAVLLHVRVTALHSIYATGKALISTCLR